MIADHIRSCAFLIVDGVLPSNEGRGYVLRRIIRRAARHGHQLGCKEPFFYKLVETLDDLMGDAYPELRKLVDHVSRVLHKEEKRFAETLEQGMRILEDSIAGMQGDTIDGETVFKLYDTYGFPVDLTADVARERNLKIDQAGFDVAMEAQRARARASSQFSASNDTLKLDEYVASGFLGYEQASNGVHLHIGNLMTGELVEGSKVFAQIDEQYRRAVMLNHSATHLMHEALRQVLGDHVLQKGSLVDSEKLRFDFSHYQPLTAEEIARIETMVNEQIRLNLETSAELMDMESARATGAMALFGEKYGDEVRVLRIGSDSVELCGGTHVKRAGDIGLFKIVLETGIASGVRRIEAVTGETAVKRFIDAEKKLDLAAQSLKASRDDLLTRIQQLTAANRSMEKELEALKSKAASQAGGDLVAQAIDVKGIKVLAAKVDGANVKTLRETVDQLKNKLGEAAIVLASSGGGKVSIIAGVTRAQTAKIKAGDLANYVAEQCGGRGGGRPDMAQAGGNQPENLPAALASVSAWAESRL